MAFAYADKYANCTKDIPTEPHWAIIEFGSVHIPGDERSKQCPGHGYGERTETTVTYEVYYTEQKWKDQITYREIGRGNFRKAYIAIKAIPAKIEIETKVSVSEG